MPESLDLRPSQRELLDAITLELKKVSGVAAIVLGGSYARGTARPDSDMDLGVYYFEGSPPDIEAIRKCSQTVADPNTTPTVVDYYEWGPWVNGGAWIQTSAGRLDLLYRNIEQVERVIAGSEQGVFQHDYYQQPTFGFVSTIYLAEIRCCLPLFDNQKVLQGLKRKVEIYPVELQKKTISICLTIAEFTLSHAHGFSDRGDILNTVGCVARIAFFLSQALFALNLEYYFGDKGSLETIERFPIRPRDFSSRLRDALTEISKPRHELRSATKQMQTLWRETVSLTEGGYLPKFGLPVET